MMLAAKSAARKFPSPGPWVSRAQRSAALDAEEEMLTSQRYDASGATHYNYFRDYDPSIGRYVESDPIGVASDDAARFFRGNRRNRPVIQAMLADTGTGWGSPNLYAYVRSTPLASADLLGLWSVTGGGYDGAGGEVSFGKNPDGKWFGSIRIGYGLGGGLSFDPNGTGPGADKCKCTWNSAIGGFGFFQSGLGPFFAGTGVNGGMMMNTGCGGPTTYFEHQPFSYGLDAGWRLRFGAAAGLEVTFY